MKDVFMEQLIRRVPTGITALAKMGIIAAAIILAFLVTTIRVLDLFVPILWCVIVFGAYILWKRTTVEYEYALTNNELDIDTIHGKSARKRFFSGNVRDFEAFRPVGSSDFAHTFNAANVRANCSSRKNNDNLYEFVATYQGKRMHIIFEPREDILNAITPQIKRINIKIGR